MKQPQLFIDAKGSPKVTIVMSEGEIRDIVKQGCPNLDLEIISYDVDSKIESDYLKDKSGKPYKTIQIK
jgi:hypothetical protein